MSIICMYIYSAIKNYIFGCETELSTRDVCVCPVTVFKNVRREMYVSPNDVFQLLLSPERISMPVKLQSCDEVEEAGECVGHGQHIHYAIL